MPTSSCKRLKALAVCAAWLGGAGVLLAQQQSSAYPGWASQTNPAAPVPYEKFSPARATTAADFQNSVPAGEANGQVLQLSLSDAIARGLGQNLGLRLNIEAQSAAAGRKQQKLQGLWPVVTASGETSWNVVDLAAEGFRATAFPNLPAGIVIPAFVKYANSAGQVNLNWSVFSLPNWEQYRRGKIDELAAANTSTDSRETVVLNVAQAYLLVLADAANVDNAIALLKADELQFRDVDAEHEAGTVANLDVLRAKVQMQEQQQEVITARRDLEKQKNALKRLIGVPVEQDINLTENVPFADLDAMAVPDLEQMAWNTRADYAAAQQQIHSAERGVRSARYERLPTFGVSGYYGVIGPTAGPYRGDFVAAASLQFPIFEEAKLRGDRDTAKAELHTSERRAENLKQAISADIRTALLNLGAARQQVELGRSNVSLVQTELNQSAQRYAAGIQDNLPVVTAQSDLSAAQFALVQSTYQYNVAKLQLARSLGLIDREWKQYLGE